MAQLNNTEIIKKYLDKYGGSPWRFNVAMLTNFDRWKHLSKIDLYDLLIIGRNKLMYHYALVPFFALYVEFDIRPMDKEIKELVDWSDEEYERLLAIFPPTFTLREASSLTSLGFEHLRLELATLKQRLTIEA